MTVPAPGEASVVAPGLVRLPGPVNAHSHAFHRVLRGRTHAGSGSFWTWREQMYAAAAALTPTRYERLATAVFAEMAAAGWTAVGEFHYVHHAPDGTPYDDHAMERALARAAQAVGIRLVLLDTLYLAGGIGQPLAPEQTRFGDGDARRWLDRLDALRRALADESDDLVTVGGAVHSVRAVPVDELAVVADGLDPDLPLHIHLSEQPAENADCLAAHGLTPTGLLDSLGLLGPRLSAVHATHLSDDDIALLGGAGSTVVMCPTTEADLGDGIGPARALADAGAHLALGSDQHAVVDPFLEMRALEHGERLASVSRGRFSPAELLAAATDGGRRSLALPIGAGSHRGREGTGHRNHDEDHVLVRTTTARTAGSLPEQLPLTASAADVASVVVGGREIARDGAHTTLGDPGELLTAYLHDQG
ncbi:formimidoylglutamate deiminase [Georgenia sp. Z1491]|uniref:formimidoylglutamate deiminase n=1 Tax=Georgenia sp. Z1491 TaxID=3416707 RepID=UPI003CEE06F3